MVASGNLATPRALLDSLERRSRALPPVHARRPGAPARARRRDPRDPVRGTRDARRRRAAGLPADAPVARPAAVRDDPSPGRGAAAHLDAARGNGLARDRGQHPPRGDRSGACTRRPGRRPTEPADAIHARRQRAGRGSDRPGHRGRGRARLTGRGRVTRARRADRRARGEPRRRRLDAAARHRPGPRRDTARPFGQAGPRDLVGDDQRRRDGARSRWCAGPAASDRVLLPVRLARALPLGRSEPQAEDDAHRDRRTTPRASPPTRRWSR